MIQTGNNMQIRQDKDSEAEVSTLDSTPNPKSTFKPNLEPSDQNAQRPLTLNTQKEISCFVDIWWYFFFVLLWRFACELYPLVVGYLLLSVSGEFLPNCLAVCLYFVVQTFCEMCLLYFVVDRHKLETQPTEPVSLT
jgi:hypothetical protein